MFKRQLKSHLLVSVNDHYPEKIDDIRVRDKINKLKNNEQLTNIKIFRIYIENY